MHSTTSNGPPSMAEEFILLAADEQAEIISALATKLGRSPAILEKDAWVCWALDALFTMPGRVQMAFKGGTSLSKVYGAIHRFSEDIDVTLDYRVLEPGSDPFQKGLSKTKQKKLTELLRSRVRDHVHDTVLPYFQDLVAERLADRDVGVSAGNATPA